MKLNHLFILILFYGSTFSQSTLEGKLYNLNSKQVSNATITISNIITSEIIAYDISDLNGSYNITFTSNAEKVQVNVRSMGYEQFSQIIENKNQVKNFTLKEQQLELKEVVVKTPPITRRGDTINYSVGAFSNTEDRSIGDVLKRMPGIEVLKDGTILYQGSPINKYYIEGLDLLEGKYSLANNNLPHYEVVKVQILENHQPVKILDSLEFSNKAALNIQLKNKNTLTGQVKAGTGYPLLLWDVNFTPMLFSKDKQMLVSYQGNNTGDDKAQQLKNLTPDLMVAGNGSDTEKQNWLNIVQIAPPGISKRFWLDNNVHVLSGNILQKLKKDYELRLNVSFLNDVQQQEGSTRSYFFTPTDTISLFEVQNNRLFYNSMETNLTLHRNTNQNYLKNSLEFQGFWDSQKGNIITNESPLTQNLSNTHLRLSNSLHNVFAVGSQLINLNSFIIFKNTPQTLQVTPGQFENLLNNGTSYNQVVQTMDLNTLFTNNSIGLSKRMGYFTFSPKAGIILETQTLKSNLSTFENENLESYFFNNLNWARSKTYLYLSSQYRRKKWRLNLSTPLSFHAYHIEDSPLQETQSLNRLTFEPTLSINLDLNTYWRIGGSAGLSNSFGSLNQMHYAYILKNYRNFQRINSPLPEIFSKNISGSFSYRNPIQSLFANLSYSFTQSENNLLYENKILPEGAIEINAFEEENSRKRHHISGRISKYISELSTSFSLYSNLSIQDFQLLLNEQLAYIQNNNKHFGALIEMDITKWFTAEYNADIFFSNNKILNQRNRNNRQISHKLNLNIHLTKNQYIGLKTEYIKNDLFSENTENAFSDLLYRFKLNNKNIDLELQWSNIFNTRNYQSIAISDYSYIETNYRLRPSQVLLSVQFSL